VYQQLESALQTLMTNMLLGKTNAKQTAQLAPQQADALLVQAPKYSGAVRIGQLGNAQPAGSLARRRQRCRCCIRRRFIDERPYFNDLSPVESLHDTAKSHCGCGRVRKLSYESSQEQAVATGTFRATLERFAQALKAGAALVDASIFLRRAAAGGAGRGGLRLDQARP
jgi:hypothetical protein